MRKDLLAVEAGKSVATTVPVAEQTAVMTAVPGAATARKREQPKKNRAWLWVLVIVALLLAGFGAAYALGAFNPRTVAVP